MFVIFNISAGHTEQAIMAGVALTGASMNPVRSLGPALVSGHLDSAWIYLTAPAPRIYLAHPTCRWI
jgi:glycerol uptake facilitator-like aquaporin